MRLIDRIKGVGIAIGILLACFPLAVMLTILSAPFWSWFERYFEVESYGHSGPAEWCYLTVYSLLVVVFTVIWARRLK